MKRLLALTLLALPLTTQAADCRWWHDAGVHIMQYRMQEKPMIDYIDGIQKMEVSDPVKTVLNSLVAKAYEKPRFSSPEYQERAVNKFANYTYKLCIDNQ